MACHKDEELNSFWILMRTRKSCRSVKNKSRLSTAGNFQFYCSKAFRLKSISSNLYPGRLSIEMRRCHQFQLDSSLFLTDGAQWAIAVTQRLHLSSSPTLALINKVKLFPWHFSCHLRPEISLGEQLEAPSSAQQVRKHFCSHFPCLRLCQGMFFMSNDNSQASICQKRLQ